LLTAAAVGGLAWGAAQGAERLWRPLARPTLRVVADLLRLSGGEVIEQPADLIVGTSEFTVEIAPSCSGVEGIALIGVFLTAFLWLFRHDLRFPAAFALLPIGVSLIWLANAARIAALIAIGTWASPSVAAGGFHSQAGWIAFNLVALGLVVVARRSRLFAAAGPARGPNPTAAYLAPLLAVLAAEVLAEALGLGRDRGYPLRLPAAALAFLAYRRCYTGLWPSRSWHAVAVGAVVAALWMLPDAAAPASGPTAGPGPWLAALPRPWAVAWRAARAVGFVVVAPVAEELAFRGYLIRRLIARDFRSVPEGRLTWRSALISSALFGALHSRWLAGTLAGLLYALAYRRRGRLGDAVLAHATTNALLVAYALATDAAEWN
jgi:exosortase E/protease (VPEID-CTERM system)